MALSSPQRDRHEWTSWGGSMTGASDGIAKLASPSVPSGFPPTVQNKIRSQPPGFLRQAFTTWRVSRADCKKALNRAEIAARNCRKPLGEDILSTVGFAPTVGGPNGFTARRLNYSATCSLGPKAMGGHARVLTREGGFEPPAHGFEGRCSTVELHPRGHPGYSHTRATR